MSEQNSGQSAETQPREPRDQALLEMRKAADAQIPEGQSFFAPGQPTGVAPPDTPPPAPAPAVTPEPVVQAAPVAEAAPSSDPQGGA